MSDSGSPPSLYPVFLDLAGRPCLVVGGGAVGAGRARGLVACGAAVKVVAPEPGADIESMARDGHIQLERRGYRESDLSDVALVVAATNVRDVNRVVGQNAKMRGIPVNVADDPGAGTFVVPSVVRRGRLAIALTTGGASPILTRRLRLELEERYGDGWADLVDLLVGMRDELVERFPDLDDRRDAVDRLMATDVVDRLARRDEPGVQEVVRRAMLAGA